MSEVEYICVFMTNPCLVRAQFKLQPESLLEFCKICPIKPTGKKAPAMENIAAAAVAKAADAIFELIRTEKEEKLVLMDLVKTLSESLAK